MTNLLEIRDLSISLIDERTELVHGLSVSLEKGDSLNILGQSGSGKSLTCRAILGLLDKKKFTVSGEINYRGKDLLTMPTEEKRKLYGSEIVYIPQNPMTAFDPSFRLGRQADETLKIHSQLSKAERKEKILSALSKAGLDDPERIWRSHPFTLSGGMLQRAVIAFAIMVDAKLIIADEPTTALDVVHRNGIMSIFSNLKANGAGIMMVTHDFATALQLGGHIAIARNGRLIESGDVREIFTKPKDEYTGKLVDAYRLSEAHEGGFHD